MYQDETENNIEIYAEEPLWINDNGNCRLIPNQYSNLNVVKVYHADGTYQEYRIGKNYTVIPEAGLILYRTQEEAVKYQSLLLGGETKLVFLNNSFIENNEVATKFVPNIECEPGLYFVQEYDYMVSDKAMLELGEIRYLLNKGDIRTANIKKPHAATGELETVFKNLVEEKGFLGKERLDAKKAIDFRLIFEVSLVDGEINIDYFPVYYRLIGDPFLRFSSLNGYPVFMTQEAAVWFREDMKNNVSPYDATIGKANKMSENAAEMREHDKKVKNTILSGIQFVAGNWDSIFKYGNIAINKIKEKIKI